MCVHLNGGHCDPVTQRAASRRIEKKELATHVRKTTVIQNCIADMDPLVLNVEETLVRVNFNFHNQRNKLSWAN